jgi:hypothetical protein
MPLENDMRAAGHGHRATNTQAITAMRGVDRDRRDLNSNPDEQLAIMHATHSFWWEQV